MLVEHQLSHFRYIATQRLFQLDISRLLEGSGLYNAPGQANWDSTNPSKSLFL